MHSLLQFQDAGKVNRGGGCVTLHITTVRYKTQLSSQMFPNERLTPETLIKTLRLLGYDESFNCYAHL